MGGLYVTRLNEYRDKPQEEASYEMFLFRQSHSKKAGGNNGDMKAQKNRHRRRTIFINHLVLFRFQYFYSLFAFASFL